MDLKKNNEKEDVWWETAGIHDHDYADDEMKWNETGYLYPAHMTSKCCRKQQELVMSEQLYRWKNPGQRWKWLKYE